MLAGPPCIFCAGLLPTNPFLLFKVANPERLPCFSIGEGWWASPEIGALFRRDPSTSSRSSIPIIFAIFELDLLEATYPSKRSNNDLTFRDQPLQLFLLIPVAAGTRQLYARMSRQRINVTLHRDTVIHHLEKFDQECAAAGLGTPETDGVAVNAAMG